MKANTTGASSTMSLLMKRKSGLPRTSSITALQSNRLSSKSGKKMTTGRRKQSDFGHCQTMATPTGGRTSMQGLQHSVSTSNIAAVKIQHVTLTGPTPRQQNRTELPSVITSCLQQSSSVASLNKDKMSTGATTTLKSSYKVPKLLKSSTQSRIGGMRDTMTTKTSFTTQARKQPTGSGGNMKDLHKLKPVLHSRNIETPPAGAPKKRSEPTTEGNEIENNNHSSSAAVHKQPHLQTAKKVSSPDSLIVPRKQNRNQPLGNQTTGINIHHTSSVLGGSSLSNTIAYFGETTSMQPSGKTLRKEQLHQLPYCQSTKVGSFQLHSGTGRSENDTTSQMGTRNHSVGRTPFESTKPATFDTNKSTMAAAVRQESSVIYAPPPTKQIKLTLSPVRHTAYQTINKIQKEYKASTKQMMRQEPGRNQMASGAPGHLSQSRGDISEDGQVQLSDLEPLSNLMEQRKPARTVVVHLTDLKNKKTQVKKGSDQAGSCDEIQIQIQQNKSGEATDLMAASLQRQADTVELCPFAQCDASFESPDVLEAARKWGRSRCDGLKNATASAAAAGSSIQILPSSLIADKKTNKISSGSMRQQILIESAQSYMMRMSQSMSSSQQMKPNPRMLALDLKSPVSKACGVADESLRWSVLSSSQRRSVSEIPDEYQSNQKRESKTFEMVTDTFEYQQMARQAHQLKTIDARKQKNLVQATPRTLCNKMHPSKKPVTCNFSEKIPKIEIDLSKKPSGGSTIDMAATSQTTTTREKNLQAALLEIRRNSQRRPTPHQRQDGLQRAFWQQDQQSKVVMHSQKPSLCLSEVSHLNMLVTTNEQIPTSLDHKEATLIDSQRRTEATADFISQQFKPLTAVNNFSSQIGLPLLDSEQVPRQQQQCGVSRNVTGTIDVVVTDWTQKLKNEPSTEQSQVRHRDTMNGGQSVASGQAGDEVLQTTSRAHCLTEMETQQTQIVHYIEGGILITESCTDGEAIVAAETEEFYGQALQVNQTHTEFYGDQQQPRQQSEASSFRSSSSGQDLPANTNQRVTPQLDDAADNSIEPLETVQTGTENEDLILENVQNFINMAYLQTTWMSVDHPLPDHEKVQIDLEDGKRLLLLDMDETLIHAATMVDIEIHQVYGPGAQPDFVTSFRDHDQDSLIEIGVFKRPFLQELIERALPHFQICIYTASEKMYADAILDVLDPDHTIFYKRLYRDKCLKAIIPSPVNHPLSDLLPSNTAAPTTNSGSNADQLHILSKNSESYDVAKEDESSSENNFYSNQMEDEEDNMPRNGSSEDIDAKTVYIKDLRVLKGVDLSQVVIVDNQLLSFALQPDNGIPISSYFFDPSDAELRYVADYLLEKYCLTGKQSGVSDLRLVNKQQFKLSSIIEHALNAHNNSYQSHQQLEAGDNSDNGSRYQASQLSRPRGSHQNEREGHDDTIEQTMEGESGGHSGHPHTIDYCEPQVCGNQEDSAQVQEQYAMHLQRGKELRRQRMNQMMQVENSGITDFNSDALSMSVTPWQKATQILNLPAMAQQAPNHQKNCRYEQQLSDQSSSYDSFARLSALQTSQALYDQTHGTLYTMTGKQLSQGELLRQPIRTQIVTEVPEALETTQKMDRRRDCIFQPTKTTSNDEASGEKQAQSFDITPQVLKIKHQHSSSWNRPSLSMLSGTDLITP